MIVCRTCLSRHDLSPLFGHHSVEKFSSDQLFLATGVKIQRNDGLPQSACKSCMKTIKKTLEFQKFSSKADQLLKELSVKHLIVKAEDVETDALRSDNRDIFDDVNVTSLEEITLNNGINNAPSNSKECIVDVKPIFADKLDVKYDDDVTDAEDSYDGDNNCDIDNTENNHNDNHDIVTDAEDNHDDHDIDDKSNNHDNLDDRNKAQGSSLKLEFDTKPVIEYMEKATINVRNLLNVNKKLKNYTSDLRKYYNTYIVNNKLYESKSHNYKTSDLKKTSKSDYKLGNFKRKQNKARNNISTFDRHKISLRRTSNKQVIKDVSSKNEASGRFNSFQFENVVPNEELDEILQNNKETNKKPEKDQSKMNFRGLQKHDIVMKKKSYLESMRRSSQVMTESEKKHQELMSLATPRSDTTTQCKQCLKVVLTSSFKTHAKTHFKPEFACDICGKTYFSRSHMSYHQQRHHGKEKRLQCPHCPFRSVDVPCMRNHVRAEHTGERPYQCDVCGASFRMRANIVQHMYTHFGVKNVQCEVCPALFNRRSQLWIHQMKTHFIDYTYHCYLCPETYRRAKPVQNHLLNVHGVPLEEQLNIKCVKTRKPEAPSNNSIGSKTIVPEVISTNLRY